MREIDRERYTELDRESDRERWTEIVREMDRESARERWTEMVRESVLLGAATFPLGRLDSGAAGPGAVRPGTPLAPASVHRLGSLPTITHSPEIHHWGGRGARCSC